MGVRETSIETGGLFGDQGISRGEKMLDPIREVVIEVARSGQIPYIF